MRSREQQLLKAATSLIRKEMHLYDAMARPAKIRYERHVEREGASQFIPLRHCGHNVPLHEPCVKCERNEDDCQEYLRVALARIKELLAAIDA